MLIAVALITVMLNGSMIVKVNPRYVQRPVKDAYIQTLVHYTIEPPESGQPTSGGY